MMRFFLAVVLFAVLGLAATLTVASLAHAEPSAEPKGTAIQAGATTKTALDKRRSILGARPSALTAGRSAANARPTKQRGWFDGLWGWVLAQQQKANRQIVGAVKALKSEGGFSAALALIMVSFIYGILHAAGPGHGKAVISSYVLANERTVRRGIKLSFLAAFFQALSAIAIITVLVVIMKATSFQIKGAEAWITTLSWGLIAVLGAWLLYGQVKALRRTWNTHKQEAESACAHHHKHGAHADDGECCGHTHMPDAQQLENDFSWRKGFLIAASVGVRPCTGALLVLIFALTNGLLWAGIAATFAMALGTAITVSILAAAAVGSRGFATRLAGGDSRWGWRIERTAGLVGSFLVFALGVSFFIASMGPTSPFLALPGCSTCSHDVRQHRS